MSLSHSLALGPSSSTFIFVTCSCVAYSRLASATFSDSDLVLFSFLVAFPFCLHFALKQSWLRSVPCVAPIVLMQWRVGFDLCFSIVRRVKFVLLISRRSVAGSSSDSRTSMVASIGGLAGPAPSPAFLWCLVLDLDPSLEGTDSPCTSSELLVGPQGFPKRVGH